MGERGCGGHGSRTRERPPKAAERAAEDTVASRIAACGRSCGKQGGGLYLASAVLVLRAEELPVF